jgi:hypothetical protein
MISKNRPTLSLPRRTTIRALTQQGRCAYCGWDLRERPIHLDHFVPYAGGGRAGDNLFASCDLCNRIKSDRHLSGKGLTDFILKMMKRHGCLADGWPEGSEDYWSMRARGQGIEPANYLELGGDRPYLY